MRSKNRISLIGAYRFLAVGLLLLLPAPARTQEVTATRCRCVEGPLPWQ